MRKIQRRKSDFMVKRQRGSAAVSYTHLSAKKPGMKKNSESGSATRKKNEIRPGRKEAGKELAVTAVPKKKQIPGQICRVEKKCGGCQLLHLTYEEQLKKKQKQVSILMKPYCTCLLYTSRCV